jgi:hypothetical protein
MYIRDFSSEFTDIMQCITNDNHLVLGNVRVKIGERTLVNIKDLKHVTTYDRDGNCGDIIIEIE